MASVRLPASRQPRTPEECPELTGLLWWVMSGLGRTRTSRKTCEFMTPERWPGLSLVVNLCIPQHVESEQTCSEKAYQLRFPVFGYQGASAQSSIATQLYYFRAQGGSSPSPPTTPSTSQVCLLPKLPGGTTMVRPLTEAFQTLTQVQL